MAATRLMRVIHDCISSVFLQESFRRDQASQMNALNVGRAGSYGAWKRNTLQSAVLR